MLYLEPKREKSDAGLEFHTAVKGDTMHFISQKYGIKMKSLLEMNRMADGDEPVQDQKIWLQSIKPAN
jgi:LysM repeat protein